MTKEEAAAALDGCQYRDEGTPDLMRQMKAARLVAVFGASDDLTMFDGAIGEEESLGKFYFDRNGLLKSECEEGNDCPYFEKLIENAPRLESDFDGRTGFYVKTDIPHVTFRVMEDDEQYGVGIVFSLDELRA